ncbi:MAG TPA: hydrogenase maturation protease [Clostridia bacterium]|nr:hydrogenase maturation protease [Clostridia bacterium]
MSKVIVIGYGNPLRSDDSFGWRATEELQKLISNNEVEFIECQQLGPELAEKISHTELVIFIDASTNGVAGTISCRNIEAAEPKSGSLTHHMDPSTLLTCALTLYKQCPEALMVTVTGECFGYGKNLSQPVAKSLPGIVHHLHEVVAQKCGMAEVAHA